MWMEGCGLPVKSFFLKKNFLLTQQGWCGCTLISTGYLHLESSRNQAAATLWAEGQTVGSIYLGKKILLKKLHSFKHLIFFKHIYMYICIYVSVWVYVICVVVPLEPQEDTISSRVTDGYEPPSVPNMAAGNRSWVLLFSSSLSTAVLSL